jgi:hypothetical protein
MSMTCVYVKSLDDDYFIFMLLYVDDMLIVANNISKVNKLKILLSKKFDWRIWVLLRIIGMEISRDKAFIRLWLSQHNYV